MRALPFQTDCLGVHERTSVADTGTDRKLAGSWQAGCFFKTLWLYLGSLKKIHTLRFCAARRILGQAIKTVYGDRTATRGPMPQDAMHQQGFDAASAQASMAKYCVGAAAA
jgi:hypothetical protein